MYQYRVGMSNYLLLPDKVAKTEKKRMRNLVLLLILVGVIWYCVANREFFQDGAPGTAGASYPFHANLADESESSLSETSGGGEGHQAGYNWAEEKEIDDVDDCDAAGNHSNSPSFAEGCRAYVEESR